MARLKTFLKYLLWFIAFYCFSNLMINIGMNTIYKNMEVKSNLSQVNITEASSTHVDGKIKGTIDLEENSDLIGKYLKVDLYSKRGVLLGTDYVKIEKQGDNRYQNIEEYFKYNDVASYNLSIVEEEQKEKEVSEIMNKSLFNLFEGFKINNSLSLGERLWLAIIAIALF